MQLCVMLSILTVLPTTAPSEATAYRDDPAVRAKIESLEARTGVRLPKFAVQPADVGRYHGALRKGPGVRNFCNKMVYAPDRGVALYCGANHNAPHRLNDVWAYHLPSNTWRLVCPPANDYVRINDYQKRAKKAREQIAKGVDVEKNKRFLEEEYPALVRKWYETVTFKDGYLQAKGTGAPINPRHTWDGLTYDHRARRLYWAVLDLGHAWKVKQYAKATGQDAEALVAQIKPASTMYVYDPQTAHWTRQTGAPPFPRMHGMGGSLTYLPDLDKTLWYIAATNRSPNDFGLWLYDAKTNTWTERLNGSTVRNLAHTKKVAPRSELQAAYSPKHRKLVAVLEKGTFIYDVAANTWSRGADTPGFGHDAHSVFAYDSTADRFLLVSRTRWRAKNAPWQLFAYDVAANAWETVTVRGAGLPNDAKAPAWRKCTFAGYYDPGHNALVLYEARHGHIWLYRHERAGAPPADRASSLDDADRQP